MENHNSNQQGPNQKRFNRGFNNMDPQIVLEGRFKRGENADTITCNYRMNEIYELVIIVTVPPEGDTRAPVYIKHKCHQPEQRIDYRLTGGDTRQRPRYRSEEFTPRDHREDDENDPELPDARRAG
jgi:hypothetical protein